MTNDSQICRFAITALFIFAMPIALAQNLQTKRLAQAGVSELQVIEDSITGDEIVDYTISLEQSQILSVDLQTSNSANYFNISPAGSAEALFIGSSEGQVADIPMASSGDFVIRVYLMRSAARRNETANYSLAISIGAPEFADSLSGGPDFWLVTGVGDGDALNMRSGPATRYPVISKVRNGQTAQNQGCRQTGDQHWCQVRLSNSGTMGWVAGRYLVETAAPRSPAVPEGGPVGNGTPFDATGSIPCSTSEGQAPQPCPFGVVRSGPGNAGIWIALGNGNERQILFESGEPVATNSADELSFEKQNYSYQVRIGDERYEIPEAVIYGG